MYKYFLVILVLLLSFCLYGQQVPDTLHKITTKKTFLGYNYFVNGEEYSPKEVKEYIQPINQEAYMLTKKASNRLRLATLISFVSGGFIAHGLLSKPKNWYTFGGGVAMYGYALFLTSKYDKLYLEAIRIFNKSIESD